MKSEALIYVPSDTPEAMVVATMKVAGVPLIVRNIMTLAALGIGRCTVLAAGSQRGKIERFLERRYDNKKLPQIEIISYDEPYRVSPEIIRRIAVSMADRFLAINSNLIFDEGLIAAFKTPSPEGDVVTCREGIHPIPIINIPLASWQGVEELALQKPVSIESCLDYILKLSHSNIQKPAAVNTFLVRRPQDRVVAEKFLAESIRHSTMGFVAKYLNKRISLPASLILAKLWISPHAITAFNIVIGLFSGVFAADGHRYWVILLGAVLFQTASIVDGCDGEVASLTFRSSKFGQYIDSLSDNLSLASFLIGLIAGYWRQTHSLVAFVMGAILIFSTAVTFFWMIRYLSRHTDSASLVTYDKEFLQKLLGQPLWLTTFIKYGKYTLKKDLFSFAFFVFALAGCLYWWLFIAAFGTTVAAVVLTYLNFCPQTTAVEGEYKALRRGEEKQIAWPIQY